MTREHFHHLLVGLTRQLSGRTLDAGLAHWLNRHHGPGSTLYEALREDCLAGVAEGWMCEHRSGGLGHGRVFKPTDDLHRYSVDVLDMDNLGTPPHRHPRGEINLFVPISPTARCDGQPAGWFVHAAGSAHSPVVSGGRALMMVLLPEGQVELMRAAA